jgi:hypothetical protein
MQNHPISTYKRPQNHQKPPISPLFTPPKYTSRAGRRTESGALITKQMAQKAAKRGKSLYGEWQKKTNARVPASGEFLHFAAILGHWGDFVAILGHFGTFLGCFVAIVGCFCAIVGFFCAIFGHFEWFLF